MKVLIVKSSLSPTPLAEIREGNGVIEFIVDNTGGNIPALVGKSYAKMLEYVDQSPHLSLEEPQQSTAHILRYILSNGEVVEITTDGRTATLNGNLLTEEQKQALFDAIRTGQISISRKADPTKPEPVLPTQRKEIKAQVPESRPLDKELAKGILDKTVKKGKGGSMQYDSEIEKAPYSANDSVAEIKKFWYDLKHGGEE